MSSFHFLGSHLHLSGFLLMDIPGILAIPSIVSHWEPLATQHKQTHTHSASHIFQAAMQIHVAISCN